MRRNEKHSAFAEIADFFDPALSAQGSPAAQHLTKPSKCRADIVVRSVSKEQKNTKTYKNHKH